MSDPATPAQVDLEAASIQIRSAVATLLGYAQDWDCAIHGEPAPMGAQAAASIVETELRALIAEVRAHRAREVFLECPACEQPCRAMPGEPSYQWWDGDSGECACGAKVTVEADGECAELVLVEQNNDAPPAVKEPTP